MDREKQNETELGRRFHEAQCSGRDALWSMLPLCYPLDWHGSFSNSHCFAKAMVLPSRFEHILPLLVFFRVHKKNSLFRCSCTEFNRVLGGVPSFVNYNRECTSWLTPRPPVEFILGRKAIFKAFCKFNRFATNFLVTQQMPNPLIE